MTSDARARRRAVGKVVVALVASAALHGALLRFAPTPDPAAPPPTRPIDVQLVEVQPPAPPPPAPIPPRPKQKHVTPRAPKRGPVQAAAPEPAPEPAPPPQDAAPVVADVAPTEPTDGAPRDEGPDAVVVDASKVDLFAAGALGSAISRWKRDAAIEDPSPLPAVADASGPEAEHARVNRRLGSAIAQALALGAVSGGLASPCDDGLDNNVDGEIDCADPGCRELAVCANTRIYTDASRAPLPDADSRGIERAIDVAQDGLVRKLSVRVRLRHGSAGDLAIELLDPAGRVAVLRSPDRGDAHFDPAFYVVEFQGRRASGRWRLRVRDLVEGTGGVLEGWALFVTS